MYLDSDNQKISVEGCSFTKNIAYHVYYYIMSKFSRVDLNLLVLDKELWIWNLFFKTNDER